MLPWHQSLEIFVGKSRPEYSTSAFVFFFTVVSFIIWRELHVVTLRRHVYRLLPELGYNKTELEGPLSQYRYDELYIQSRKCN